MLNIVEFANANKDLTGTNLSLKESVQLSEKKVRPYGMKYPGGEKTKPMLAANKYGDDKVAFGTNFKFDATKRFMPLVKRSIEKEEAKNPLSQSITSLKTKTTLPGDASAVPIKNEDLTNRLLNVKEMLFKKFYPELAAQQPKKKPEIFENKQALRSKKKSENNQKKRELYSSDNKSSSTEASPVLFRSASPKPNLQRGRETNPKGFVTQRYEVLLAHHN